MVFNITSFQFFLQHQLDVCPKPITRDSSSVSNDPFPKISGRLKGGTSTVLVAYGPIEAFDEYIINWFSGSAEIQLDTITIYPIIKNLAAKFRALQNILP